MADPVEETQAAFEAWVASLGGLNASDKAIARLATEWATEWAQARIAQLERVREAAMDSCKAWNEARDWLDDEPEIPTEDRARWNGANNHLAAALAASKSEEGK